MENPKERGALPKLLSEAILQLCRVGVGLHGSFSIDGIICIENVDSESQEVVVKIHEKICGGVLQTGNNASQVVNSPVTQSSANTLSPRISNVLNSNTGTQNYNNTTQNLSNNAQVSYSASSGAQRHDFPYLNDSDCEILDDTAHKQLFGELGNICDTDLGRLYDVDFGEMSIKPDPAQRSKNSSSPSQIAATSHIPEDVSDDELRIEKLTAGRVRKPPKARNSYKDVHGASVQVLSFEEYSRTLKSEKLKRGRDRSPDFISSKRVIKSAPEQYPFHRQHNIISQAYQTATDMSQIASVHDANIASIRSLSSVTGASTSNVDSIVGRKIPTTFLSTPTVNEQRMIDSVAQGQYVNAGISAWNQSTGKQIVTGQSETVTKYIPKSATSLGKSYSVLTTSNDGAATTRNNGVKITYHSTRKSRNRSKKSATVGAGGGKQFINGSGMAATNTVAATETVTTSENYVPRGRVCFEDFNQKPHKCPCCLEIYDTFKDLDFHMCSVHQSKFMCPLCGKLFKQKNTRNRHIVAIHSEAKNFACNLCGVSFTRIDSIKKHYKSHHPDMEVPKCPYSYKRGEANVPKEPELVYMQDIAGSDIKYIEENLMTVVGPGDVIQDVIVQDVVDTNLVVPDDANIPNTTHNPNNSVAHMFDVINGQHLTLEPVSTNVILEAIQSLNDDTRVIGRTSSSVALNAPQIIDVSSNHSDSIHDENQKINSFVSIIKSGSTNNLCESNTTSSENCEILATNSRKQEDNQNGENRVITDDESSNLLANLEVQSCTSGAVRCDTASPQSDPASTSASDYVYTTAMPVHSQILHNLASLQTETRDPSANKPQSFQQTEKATHLRDSDSIISQTAQQTGKSTNVRDSDVTTKGPTPAGITVPIDRPMCGHSASVSITTTVPNVALGGSGGTNMAPSVQEVSTSQLCQPAPSRRHSLVQVIRNVSSSPTLSATLSDSYNQNIQVTTSQMVSFNSQLPVSVVRQLPVTVVRHLPVSVVRDDKRKERETETEPANTVTDGNGDADKAECSIDISDEEMGSPD